jgi:hypothetical protein
MMWRTTDFHDAIANAPFPDATGVAHDAILRDTAVDRLDTHATAGHVPIAALRMPKSVLKNVAHV